MKKSVSKAVDRIHKALKKDVKYYAPMGQRGPVIHTIVDYESIIVPLDYEHDELAVFCHDDCELRTLDDAIEILRDGGYTDDDAELCEDIADACSGKFERTGDYPNEFRWGDEGKSASEALRRYEFENVVDVLNSICGYGSTDDGYETVGVLYEPVVDRSAQFLTHAEAERHLRLGSYSKRAHTYCCHIPDDSLLAQLLEAVGPVHH
jgi:hypothetical protein